MSDTEGNWSNWGDHEVERSNEAVHVGSSSLVKSRIRLNIVCVVWECLDVADSESVFEISE